MLEKGTLWSIRFAFFEALASRWRQPGVSELITDMVAGVTVNMVGLVVCNPLSVVRTKIMGYEMYTQIGSTARQIHKQHGWTGFTAGLGPKVCCSLMQVPVGLALFNLMK